MPNQKTMLAGRYYVAVRAYRPRFCVVDRVTREVVADDLDRPEAREMAKRKNAETAHA